MMVFSLKLSLILATWSFLVELHLACELKMGANILHSIQKHHVLGDNQSNNLCYNVTNTLDVIMYWHKNTGWYIGCHLKSIT